MDETTMSLHPPLRCCWMKKGKQKLIPAPGYQQRRHWFGGYNWCSDEVWSIHCTRRNSKGFVLFIEYLMTKIYPTKKVVLVMDNASFHKSAMAQAALDLFKDRLQIIWLPKYCPFLNPIERFWQHLKVLSNVNRLHDSLQSLIDCTEHHLQEQNDLTYSERFTFCKNL
jgi:transposase